jgi:dTMP kinase
LEAEPAEYHRAVRAGFLAVAAADPARYEVLDATLPEQVLAAHILDRVLGALP